MSSHYENHIADKQKDAGAARTGRPDPPDTVFLISVGWRLAYPRTADVGYPAWSAIGVSEFIPENALVEIRVVAKR